MGIAADIAVILIASLFFGLIVQKFKQPLVLGYILAGMVVGPFALGLIRDLDAINFLAELGVALLLFALGIQFSFKDLMSVRWIALIGTPLQMLLTIGYGVFVAQIFGWEWVTAVWFGAVIALSNTMVILKTLMSRGLLGTLSSRVMLSMLVVQDLAAIPLIIALPALGDLSAGLPELAEAGLRGGIFLLVMIFAGTRVIPRLMRLIVSWNSRELFLLSVAALGLGVGYLTFLFGLSFAFGAFVAGMVISESDYSYQALSDIIPLRDLFSLLFFTSIGMLLDPRVLIAELDAVLLMVGLIMIGKIVIFGVVTRLFGYGNIAPFAIGLTMFQLGEFSFVLASEGLNNGAFSPEQYGLILNAAIITLVLTPFLSRLADPLYALRKRLFDHEPLITAHIPEAGLRDHVIIVGQGRIGRYVADTLRRFDSPFVVIELDSRRFEQCRDEGYPAIYGDATQDTVLQTANLETARLLIDTVPSVVATHMIADHVARLNPSLHIVARVEGMDDMYHLRDRGIHELVQPQFEAGMEIARQALLHLGVSSAEIQHYSDQVRETQYAPMYADHPEYPIVAQMKTASRMMNFCWVNLHDTSPLLNRSLEEMAIRDRTGVSIVGILRDGDLMPNPGGKERFLPGDLIAIMGIREQINTFQQMAGQWAYEIEVPQDGLPDLNPLPSVDQAGD